MQISVTCREFADVQPLDGLEIRDSLPNSWSFLKELIIFDAQYVHQSRMLVSKMSPPAVGLNSGLLFTTQPSGECQAFTIVFII